MMHRLFTFASAVSLLLFLGSVTLWAHSYFFLDHLTRLSKRGFDIAFYEGDVRVLIGQTSPRSPRWSCGPISLADDDDFLAFAWWRIYDGKEIRTHFRSGDFAVISSTGRQEFLTFTLGNDPMESKLPQVGRSIELMAPDWVLLVAMGFLPMLWLWGLRRQRRRRSKGLCPKCGYDLRASPKRCPECGTPVPQKQTAPI